MLWNLIRYGWALPATLAGLALVAVVVSTGGRAVLREGVCEACGGWPGKWLGLNLPFSGRVSALTIGHVVIGDSASSLAATRAHEREHVRQYERWGMALLPAYLIAGLWVWLRGGHPYRDNAFEVAARKAEASSRSDG